MATTLTTTSFSSTYKDDFKDSDNYHRILFNSGKALQARELTQMQTIIQKEIERFGSNIFKEGGVVRPGGPSIDKYEFIKLATGELPSSYSAIIGKTFTIAAPAAQVQVKITGVIEASGSDPDTLVVQYVDTSSGTAGTNPIRVGNSQTLQNSTLGSGYDMITAAADAAGQGLRFSVGESVIFAQGHFVFVEPQTIYPSKYTTSFEGDVGFKVTQDIVSVDDTNALYDNQGATPNLASPGADRYRIKLTLSKRSDLAAADNFVYLCKLLNDKIVDTTTVSDSYSTLNDVLALRTKEESGDYISKSMVAKFNDLNDSNLQLEISDGVYYIDGYRVEIPSTKLTVPRAQDTITLANETVVAQYGNYVLCNYLNNDGIPNIGSFPKVNLRNATGYGGSTIGTAFVRAIAESTGNNMAVYLFDIQMSGSNSFGAVRSLGTSSSDFMNTVLENGISVLKNTSGNSLLFSLPNQRPQQTGQSYDNIEIQKRYTFTTNGSGATAAAITTGVTGGTFTDENDWVVSRTDGAIDNSVTITNNGSNFTMTGGDGTQAYEVIARVTKASPTPRSKSLSSPVELSISWPSAALTDNAGNNYIDLGKTDIYNVSDIRLTNSSGADLSSNFTIDNGQRDNFYGYGRLVQKGGTTLPTATIYVKFTHFEHQSGGDFFDVTSYNPAQVDYENIPSHRLNNGETVSLRDVFDFRPTAAAYGANSQTYHFDSNGYGSANFLLPTAGSTMSADIVYYQSRNDRLIAVPGAKDSVNIPGTYKVISGVSDLEPKFPDIPATAMNLMNIEFNPYTINESDLTTTLIPNKKFQMKDIAELEQRIDELQELTTLSLLELNTSSLTVLDSDGNTRTKAGFLVDNFRDYSFSATNRDEYRASIDDLEGLLTVEQYPTNTRLIFDSDNSTVERRGDIITLPISSHETFVDQNLATETINVNPFAVITNEGSCKLSPKSDEWVETKYTPDRIVNETRYVNGGRINTFNNLANWKNQWVGRPIGNQVTIRGKVTVRREQIADRVIDIQVIPFMRSRKVYFKAEGLRPNTKHFAFFNGAAIGNYTREESAFLRFGTQNTDIGNQYTNRTSHPSGSGDLISNAAGEIIGSFIIPSNSSLKFRTGSKEFKLLDISTDNEANATSMAASTFTSTGILETRQRTIRSTRIEERITVRQFPRPSDPVAQTFFINGKEYPNGVFITKADLYFASKDDNIPVRAEIRAVENGVPVSGPLPDAYVYKAPSGVSTTSSSSTLSTVQGAPTNFEFEEPVYLLPDREYAIVVKAESTDYNVYVAKTYDFQLGSTERRITRQPTMGSLFTSQNGFTWTPDQSRDLMFKLYRADFDASGQATVENVAVAAKLLDNNPLQMTSSDATVRVFHEGHGFSRGDKVNISGLTDATTYAGVLGSSLNGTRSITAVDWTGYTFEADSNASSTIRAGGDGVIASQNVMYDAYVPNITNIIPDETSLSGKVKLTSGESFAGNRNLITASPAKASSFTTITLNEFNFNNSPQVILSDSNESFSLSGNKSITMQLDLSTSDTKVSPIIDLQRLSMTTFENVIDKQDSASTDGFNVPLSFVAETHPSDGTHAGKHVTSPVTLADQAVGLKILFAANRPSAAGFKVYYKTATSDENLDEVNWVSLAETSNNPADEIKTIYREYEYLAGGNTGTLNAFTQFQVKIVMTSTNSSKVPTIKDLRTIAMVT